MSEAVRGAACPGAASPQGAVDDPQAQLTTIDWISAGDTPNLVLFSVDDEIVSEAWQAAYYDTIQSSGISNPNGCKPPITW